MTTGSSVDRRAALGRADVVLILLGATSVVAGGLVAAVTAPFELADGSWLAAYLVLVCGVGSLAVGAVPAWTSAPRTGTTTQRPTSAPPSRTTVRRAWLLLVAWVLGNVAVVVGSLLATPYVVDVGSVLLVVALVMALVDTAGRAASGDAVRRTVLAAYRLVLVVLLVSVPVGVVLAHVRNG